MLGQEHCFPIRQAVGHESAISPGDDDLFSFILGTSNIDCALTVDAGQQHRRRKKGL